MHSRGDETKRGQMEIAQKETDRQRGGRRRHKQTGEIVCTYWILMLASCCISHFYLTLSMIANFYHLCHFATFLYWKRLCTESQWKLSLWLPSLFVWEENWMGAANRNKNMEVTRKKYTSIWYVIEFSSPFEKQKCPICLCIHFDEKMNEKKMFANIIVIVIIMKIP